MSTTMNAAHTIDILAVIEPETSLERKILSNDAFVSGLQWGSPRFGHPEGKIILHVGEVLRNIDKLPISKEQRRILRIVAIVHDTFKCSEDRNTPRDWSKHHSVLAFNFIQKYTDEKAILQTTLHHDEPFYAWLHIHKNQEELSNKKLEFIKSNVDDLNLLYYFFLCDTMTGDKLLKPLVWFENQMGIESLSEYLI